MIWDTRSSFGLTPFRSDFIDYFKADIPIKYVTKVNWVIIIGNTIKCFVDVNGTTCYLPCVYYHLPSTDVQLFSSQTYHNMHGGYYTAHGHHIMMHLKDNKIKIHIDSKHANIHIITGFFNVLGRKISLDHSCGLLWIIMIPSSWISLDTLEPEGFIVIFPFIRDLMQYIMNLKNTLRFLTCVLVQMIMRTFLDHKRI